MKGTWSLCIFFTTNAIILVFFASVSKISNGPVLCSKRLDFGGQKYTLLSLGYIAKHAASLFIKTALPIFSASFRLVVLTTIQKIFFITANLSLMAQKARRFP